MKESEKEGGEGGGRRKWAEGKRVGKVKEKTFNCRVFLRLQRLGGINRRMIPDTMSSSKGTAQHRNFYDLP